MNHQHTTTLRGRSLLEALASEADLSALQHANLDGCGLTAFRSDILQLSNLSALSFYDNQLTDVPHDIARLRHLRTLNLAQNPFST